ncbi:hypothetical protein AAIR98_000484 [Elusimicrobium simillimum]|uniref:hypothetical protein n=1 Tax=Elusimicrobium simillimum TaxID=3143438 RepID=UPI003C6ECDF3
MKRTLTLLVVACAITCGCGSSLAYRKDVIKDVTDGKYAAAASKIELNKNKMYKDRDSLLYYLDLGLVQHEGGKAVDSDINFAAAQDRIDELFTVSVTKTIGTVVQSELDSSYKGQEYERSLTYFYRAMNFLDRKDLQGALVEARKAVFYLDNLRRNKAKGYNDDPFVQYFASLLFESGGNLSSARISRTNAVNAYGKYGFDAPNFTVPANANQMGEIIFLHYNGHIPLLTSRSIQVAWNDALISINGTDELANADASVQNAIMAGITGNAVTVAYPVFTDVPYSVRGSIVAVGDIYQNTVLVHDIGMAAKASLAERMPGIYARLVARAVIKQILNVQARHAVTKATDNENWGMLAGMLMAGFNAAIEKADTRMWFTLPDQIRMTRMFVPPGTHTIRFAATDDFGTVLDTKNFENVEVKAGGRVYLHHRTGK